MWDLSSPGIEPMAPAVEVWSLNHWTPREVLFAPFSEDSSTHGTIQCSSVAKSYLALCNPMDCNTPGFPVLYHLPEFA